MKFTVEQFVKFTDQFEGTVSTMYRDSENLVTVGLGNKIDPVQDGWGLPWAHRSDGSPATQSEYIGEWNTIKTSPGLEKEGWRYASAMCRLYLKAEAILELVKARLSSNESFLRQGFQDYDSFCADAQLFLHSMAWACGGAFWQDRPRGYPRLRRLVNARGWKAAINECDINPKVGTIILRNSANRQLLMNAAIVRDSELDGNVLYYPKTANAGSDEFDHTVQGIQHALALLGWNIKQDGIMGPKTLDAIKKFQAIQKLKVDGIVGPLTYEALAERLKHR